MLPLTITATANRNDGQTVRLTLSAVPTGTLHAYGSRLPGFTVDPTTELAWSVVAGSNGLQYDVTCHAGVLLTRLCYYLVVVDGNGESNEVCEWVCQGSNQDLLNQIYGALQDVLLDNRPALDASVRAVWGSPTWPDGTSVQVKRVLTGPVEGEGETPAIAIRVHSLQEDLYFGNPYTDVIPVQAEITCYTLHQGLVSHEPLVAALGMGVFNVLNQVHYLQLPLPSGLTCYAAHCGGLQTDETGQPELGCYLATATLGWTAEVQYGKIV